VAEKLNRNAPAKVYYRAERVFGRPSCKEPLRVLIYLKEEAKPIVLEHGFFHTEGSDTINEYDARGRTKFAQLVPQIERVVVKTRSDDPGEPFDSYDAFIRRLMRDM